MSRGLKAIMLLVAGLILPCVQLAAKPRTAQIQAEDSPVGEAIYLKGILGSGAPLTATRANAEPSRGQAAACVNCHRRSGLGAQEGRSIIPPITGSFLFDAHDTAQDTQLPYIPCERLNRTPYTEETLARALREGIDSQRRTLNYLMPRFERDE